MAYSGHKYSAGVEQIYEDEIEEVITEEPEPMPAETADDAKGKGTIEAGNPSYHEKDGDTMQKEWEKMGWLVGFSSEAPDFRVEILNINKELIKRTESGKLDDGGSVYVIWLLPGTYTLLVKADDYADFDLHELEVKAGYDLRVDLEFTYAGVAKEDALMEDN